MEDAFVCIDTGRARKSDSCVPGFQGVLNAMIECGRDYAALPEKDFSTRMNTHKVKSVFT